MTVRGAVRPAARVLARAATGAVVSVAGQRVLRTGVRADRWERRNHRGRPVSLLAGPAVALGATVTGRPGLPARGLVGAGVLALGWYDDVVGDRPGQHPSKGFRGHLGALRGGRVTTGTVKLAGIAAVSVAGAALRGVPGRRTRDRGVDVLLDGAVVAGAANLLNLLDLRPGRALKVALALALALGEPGLAGAAAAGLPGDLGERTMLGDGGANALGALLGLAFVDRVDARCGRLLALATLAALGAASERVSFTAVIDATPVLRRLDRLGRLP